MSDAMKITPILTRLLKRADIRIDTGCWEWTGATSKEGYGKAWSRHHPGQQYTHRIAYVEAFGPIPDGLELDHTCRSRSCFNPAHLRAVTHYENMLAGNTFTRANLAKTHCSKGHPFTDANTYHYNGARKCRTCNRLYVAAYTQAHREAVNAKARTVYHSRKANRATEEGEGS